MIGELAGENTSDVSLIHYGDKGVVFDVRGVDEGGDPRFAHLLLADIHTSSACHGLDESYWRPFQERLRLALQPCCMVSSCQ